MTWKKCYFHQLIVKKASAKTGTVTFNLINIRVISIMSNELGYILMKQFLFLGGMLLMLLHVQYVLIEKSFQKAAKLEKIQNLFKPVYKP